jgi:glycosyltransferase involved in cell wall biosynthesis
VVVHQLLSGAGPFDAVTSQAAELRRLFRSWGWEGEDFAAAIDPRVNGTPGWRVRELRSLHPAPEDVLLVHYSAYTPRLRPVLGLPNRKMVLSHNVTPAAYFWGYDPLAAVQCASGRTQLPRFARAADLAVGVSEYNAAELRQAGARRTAVIPVLFDRHRLGPPGPAPSDPRTILCVGRLAPHKRQDEVLRAFALYRRQQAPDARLVLVGEPLTPGYRAALQRLAQELTPGAVIIESGISPQRLGRRYREAHALLCLSEHEGFCLPLLEAFHFGVPVIARPVGGVPEVAGDAALLLDDRDLAVIAELVHLAVSDAALRVELRRRGEARLAVYDRERTAERLRAALTAL